MNRSPGSAGEMVTGVPAWAATSCAHCAESTLMWSISPTVANDAESASTSWQSACSTSRCSAAPRRTGFSPTGTMPVIPAAASTAEKNGVFCSSTPTCGGLAGSRRARSAAATEAA